MGAAWRSSRVLAPLPGRCDIRSALPGSTQGRPRDIPDSLAGAPNPVQSLVKSGHGPTASARARYMQSHGPGSLALHCHCSPAGPGQACAGCSSIKSGIQSAGCPWQNAGMPSCTETQDHVSSSMSARRRDFLCFLWPGVVSGPPSARAPSRSSPEPAPSEPSSSLLPSSSELEPSCSSSGCGKGGGNRPGALSWAPRSRAALGSWLSRAPPRPLPLQRLTPPTATLRSAAASAAASSRENSPQARSNSTTGPDSSLHGRRCRPSA